MGSALRGRARQCSAKRDRMEQYKPRQSKEGQGSARQGMSRKAWAGQSRAEQCKARQGKEK